MISTNPKVVKFSDKFINKGNKLLKKLSTPTYLRTFGSYQVYVSAGNKSLIATSNDFVNISARKTIVDTLKEIDYVRTGNWTVKTAIAFMDEVINLFSFEADDEIIEERKFEIARRYNVPVSRLKTQVALFINNLYKGIDKYRINYYFSKYEIVKWKYRDIQKIQEDVENNKLLDIDREILEELEII